MNTICRFVKTHPEVDMHINVEKEDVTGSAGVEICMSTVTNDYRRYVSVNRTFKMDMVSDPSLEEKILFEMYQIIMDRKNGKPSDVVYRDK